MGFLSQNHWCFSLSHDQPLSTKYGTRIPSFILKLPLIYSFTWKSIWWWIHVEQIGGPSRQKILEQISTLAVLWLINWSEILFFLEVWKYQKKHKVWNPLIISISSVCGGIYMLLFDQIKNGRIAFFRSMAVCQVFVSPFWPGGNKCQKWIIFCLLFWTGITCHTLKICCESLYS